MDWNHRWRSVEFYLLEPHAEDGLAMVPSHRVYGTNMSVDPTVIDELVNVAMRRGSRSKDGAASATTRRTR
jgi:hypothetical protein